MSDKFVASLNHVRLTPRKARLVVDTVRGRFVGDALERLSVLKKKGAPLVAKLINSAIANARDKSKVDVDRLVVSEICVGAGMTWKRFMPRAQGRAAPILKRTSRIIVKLMEK